MTHGGCPVGVRHGGRPTGLGVNGHTMSQHNPCCPPTPPQRGPCVSRQGMHVPNVGPADRMPESCCRRLVTGGRVHCSAKDAHAKSPCLPPLQYGWVGGGISWHFTFAWGISRFKLTVQFPTAKFRAAHQQYTLWTLAGGTTQNPWAPQNHLEERLLDQAQVRASYTPPPFLGSFA